MTNSHAINRDAVIEARPVKHWPFIETPGEFTARVAAHSDGPGGLLAGLRHALIEDPPTLSREYLTSALASFSAPVAEHDTGHPHLIAGEFQSDKYPATPRGKVPLSVKDKTAQDLLWEYAKRRRSVDAEFSDDLETALRSAGYDPSPSPPVIVTDAMVEAAVTGFHPLHWDGDMKLKHLDLNGRMRSALTAALSRAGEG